MTISQALVDLPLPTGFPGGFVERKRLVRRLDARVPVALVVAAAGHGKSTTVAQWATRDSRRTTWLPLGDVCGDSPAALLAAIAAALDGSGPSEGPDDLAGVLARLHEPRSLVLDDFGAVEAPGALEAISELADRVPAGSRLTIISRRVPALALGRLRGRRRVVELRRGDLALTSSETSAALRLTGVEAPADAVDALFRRTEGWPAAVDLAAFAAVDAPDAGLVLRAFSGADRQFAEYVRDEILADLSAAELDFLVRTSILDRLTGPLCDAVLCRTDSARTLHELSGSTGLLVPLDPGERWYRHHRLFAEALRARLALGDASTACVAHARASRWYAEAAAVEPAVVHAVAAGDAGAVGDLLFDSVASCADATGGPLVHRWIDRFSAAEVRRFPALSLAAARSAWTRGELDRAEHLARIAAAAITESGPEPRRTELRAAALVMRASVARDGMSRMAEDAARAARDLPEHSGWTARSRLLAGVALHLLGRREEAVEHLEEGAHRAAVGAPDVRALCLAQLALLAEDRGAQDEAAILAARARAHVDTPDRDRCATDALILALSAMTLAERGVVGQATRDAREAARLAGQLTDFVPWYEAEVRIALARAELRLSNVATTKSRLYEAVRILRPVPDAPVLREWIEAAWARTDAYCAAALVAPALTMAELRVLRFLPTHLSFGEIAQRLFVSANTIKTQAHAVYRKLDASSRSGAVARGLELGLLDGWRA